MNINVNSCKEINYEWYKKPFKTGVVLNFRSCTPIQQKKNIVEGTVHGVLGSTGNWRNFEQALKKNVGIWLKINNTEGWTSKIINDALQKIISRPLLKNGGEKLQEMRQNLPGKDVKPIFFLQYRGNSSLQLKQNIGKNVRIDNHIHNAKTTKTIKTRCFVYAYL